MRLFHVLLIIGLLLMIIATVLEGSFDDHFSDVSFGAEFDEIRVSETTMALIRGSFLIGAGCFLSSFAFVSDRKLTSLFPK